MNVNHVEDSFQLLSDIIICVSTTNYEGVLDYPNDLIPLTLNQYHFFGNCPLIIFKFLDPFPTQQFERFDNERIDLANLI